MKPLLISIDDQDDVRASLLRDIAVFEKYCDIIDCESADEAEEVLEEADAKGQPIAVLICDQVMPDKDGVSFLKEVQQDDRFKQTKKMLLTGQATHDDTILAINNASIDYYCTKPWTPEAIVQIVKKLFTQYLVATGMDYRSFEGCVDMDVVLDSLH